MILGMFNPDGALRGGIEHIYRRADDPEPPLAELKRIREAGRTPLLTVEPWQGVGRLLDWLPRLRGPLYLRYGHEMNGNWYPWSENPRRYVKDWQAIARQQRDPQVRLVWCPNVAFPESRPLAAYWPGPVMDDLGLDGYNWGAPWRPFAKIFGPSLAEVAALAPRMPILICEVGCPRRQARTAWIRAMWQTLGDEPRVAAVAWFNEDKERPWRLTGKALAAFLAGAA